MDLAAKLQAAGLRSTPKRLAIARLLFDGEDMHVAADAVARMAAQAGLRVSLATVYNTLNQFVAAGLLRRVNLDSERSYFDTNTASHQHIYVEDEQRLIDIPGGQIRVSGLPALPEGMEVRAVEVMVRVGAPMPTQG